MSPASAAVPTADVSVVVPAHDAADTIEETLRSALAQSPAPSEIIVVDDASKDATLEVVRRIAAQDPRVRLIALPSNGGVSIARNTGTAAATSTWVAFLDADDIWLEGKLREQLALAENRPELSMIGTWYQEQFGDRLGAVRAEFWWQSSLLVRRSVFETVAFDPAWRVSELPEFLSRFDERFERDGVPQPLMRYRMNLSGLAHSSFMTERKAWELVGENARRRSRGDDPIPFDRLEVWFKRSRPFGRRMLALVRWRGDLFLRGALIEASRRRLLRAAGYGALGAALNPRSVVTKWGRLRSAR